LVLQTFGDGGHLPYVWNKKYIVQVMDMQVVVHSAGSTFCNRWAVC